MGTPKEGVILRDGRPMIEHVLEPLRAVCERVVVVGIPPGPRRANTRFAPTPDIVRLPDLHPGAGPLAGIETLLASGLDRAYLVVACDQPLLTPAILRRLVDAAAGGAAFFQAEDGRRLHPFPGVFPEDWLPRVQEALRHGNRSVRRLVESCEAAWVTISAAEEDLLRSINTPDQLARLGAGGFGPRPTG